MQTGVVLVRDRVTIRQSTKNGAKCHLLKDEVIAVKYTCFKPKQFKGHFDAGQREPAKIL